MTQLLFNFALFVMRLYVWVIFPVAVAESLVISFLYVQWGFTPEMLYNAIKARFWAIKANLKG